MARRDDALGVRGADTVIGPGVEVKGKLISESDMVIDGRVTGEIKAGGIVTIGVNAEIVAPLTAEGLTVGGHLEGSIKVTGEVLVLSTGRVEGDITSGGLSIESGGVFNGTSKVETIAHPLHRAKPTTKSPEE